jgi:hypothetical protein
MVGDWDSWCILVSWHWLSILVRKGTSLTKEQGDSKDGMAGLITDCQLAIYELNQSFSICYSGIQWSR